MKKEVDLPLSLDKLGNILKNNFEAQYDFRSTVILPSNTKDVNNSIREIIFRNVFNEWEEGGGVVVGSNKLLCEALLEELSIVEQAKTIQNKQVIMFDAKIKIIADPGHEPEIKRQKPTR